MSHELKCWPASFWDITTGKKTFDVRRWDRPYQVGDELHLREWDPSTQKYSGHNLTRRVTYLQMGGQFGVDPGYCVLGLGAP